MASQTSRVAQSSLQSFWSSLSPSRDEKKIEDTEASIESSIKTAKKVGNWIVENRAGLAFLTGLVMVPSQFLGPNAEKSNEIIIRASRSKEFKLERFEVLVGDDFSLGGVLYFPKNWNPKDKSRCVLYHNPNGITVSGYFEMGILSWTPAEIVKVFNCPVVMYDYRGTGLSENACSSSLAFRPTYETVVVDGEAALQFALSRFESVKVMGSSLGGGVATASLERHLKRTPADSKRVSLFNHDSFSTTTRVAMPNWPNVGYYTGWAIGGLLDAETPMKSLIHRDISIIILCHKKDPVIPESARMAEYVKSLWRGSRNVSIIYSSRIGHANLSEDMSYDLRRVVEIPPAVSQVLEKNREKIVLDELDG